MKNKFTKKYKNVRSYKSTQGMAKLSLAVFSRSLGAAKRAASGLFNFTKNHSISSAPCARKLSLLNGSLSSVKDQHCVDSTSCARALSRLSVDQKQRSADSIPCARALSQLCAANSLLKRQASSTSCARALSLLGVLAFVALPLMILAQSQGVAQAQQSEYLNFQGRLLTSSGSLVPDGDYHIEFKLYNDATSTGSSQGSCAGDTNCLWTETRSTGNLVTIRNGYFSAYLGDVTSLPAIDWSQDLFLGMNIGGDAGAASWDGEMSPRFKLTAVPFAFTSQNVASADTNAATTDSSGVTIQTGDALGATSDSGNITISTGNSTNQNSGNVSIDVGTAASGTAGTITLGSSNASALTIGRAGATTTLQGPISLSGNVTVTGSNTLTVGAGTATFNGNVTVGNATSDTLTVEANATFNGSLTVSTGDQFTNAGSTLFTALAIGNIPSGGNIGTAAATVDVATTFNVTQTTASQTLTLPSPTVTTAGRVVYVNNTGSADFTMYGDTIETGSSGSFIWNGSAWVGTVSFASTGVETVGAIDGGSYSANGASISGTTIYLQTASLTQVGLINLSAQEFDGVKTFDDRAVFQAGLTVDAGQSISLTGSGTRPGSPTAGDIFYDTTTNTLLTYNGTKWVADRGEYIIVAANDSTQAEKDAADYVADGTSDETEINSALTAAAGGKVLLLAGTYVADGTILVPNNTTLAGVGPGTVIELADIDTTDNLIENSDTTTGTGVVIRDLKLDGRSDLNTVGEQIAISIDGLGSDTADRSGGTINNIEIEDFSQEGVLINDSDFISITDSRFINVIDNSIEALESGFLNIEGNFISSTVATTDDGIIFFGVNDSSITANNIQDSRLAISLTDTVGLLRSVNNTVSGNTINGGNQQGISIFDADYNSVTGNTITGVAYGIYVLGDSNTITGNNVQDSAVWFTSAATENNFIGNSIFAGKILVAGDDTLVQSNYVEQSASEAIDVTGDRNSIIGNRLVDSSGATDNDAIAVISAIDTLITGNIITDSSCTSTCYAINVFNAASENTYISNNTLGGGTINDAGTNTIYANQAVAGDTLRSGSSIIQAYSSRTLTGTADPAASTTLPGTGTFFLTELQVGDRITINAETRTVTAIASNTSLTVDTAFTDTAAAAVTRLPAALVVKNSAGANTVTVNDAGTLILGNSTLGGSLAVSDGSDNYVTINASALAGNYTVSIPTITGNTSFCLASGNCSGLGGLQAAYDIGNTISTSGYTAGRDISFTLTDETTDSDFIIDILTGSTSAFEIRNNGTAALSYTIANGLSVVGGTNSERFGAGASAAGSNALAVGNAASTTGNDTLAVGYNATTSGGNSVAVGSGATAGADGSALGLSASASGTNATAVGQSSSAGANSTSLGRSSTSTNFGTAIGAYSNSGAGYSVAIGRSATTTAGNAVALGAYATANVAGGVAVGDSAVALGNSIALGRGATNTTTNQLVVGANSYAINQGYFGNGVTNAAPSAFTLNATGGSGTNIAGANLTLAGGRSTGSAAGGSLLFQTSAAGASGTTLNALTTYYTLNSAGLLQGSNGATISVPGGTNSERFGAGASAAGSNALAVGNSAVASGNDSIAIGSGATSGQYSTVIGQSANSSGQYAVVIGIGANSSATVNANNVIIGRSATATAGPNANNVLIGANTSSTAINGTVVGYGSTQTAGSAAGIILGQSSTTANQNSIIIGNNLATTANNQLVVGDVNQGYFGNGVTNASPGAFTLNATGGSGTDINGANLTLAAGRGTGAGTGGSLLFQTATAGGTGSSLNALTTRLTIDQTGLSTFSGTLAVNTLGTTNTDAVLCRNGSNQLAACSSTFATVPASGSFLRQVPTTTAENTITPTAASVVGLTVNGTSGTAATALSVVQAGNSSALTIDGSGTGNLATLDTTNASANGVSIDLQSSSSSQYALNITSNNGATNALYVRADGNIGVGTNSPSAKFDVRASGDARIRSYTTSSTNISGLILGTDAGLSASSLFQGGSTYSSYGGANSLNLINTLAGSLALGVDNSVDFIITTGGNIGIGTTSPSSTLSVGTGTTNNFNIAGATGTVTTNGGYTQSGTVANTFSGATSLTATGTALSVTNNADIGGTLFVGTGDAFQVSSGGAVTAVGVNSGTGLLQGTGGLTVTGTTNINATGTAATTIGNSTGTLALLGGNSTNLLVGTGANTTTLNFTAPSGNNTITFPAATGTVQLAPASGSFLRQVPTTTAENTITPTAASVVGLTVNGTSGTAATALAVSQAGAATGLSVTSSSTGTGQSISLTNTTGTQANGLLINRNGAGGTTTTLLGLTNTAGTATNGILFTGTITNDITTAAARALTINTGTTGALNLDTGTTGAINIGTNTSAKTINLGTGGTGVKSINIGGTAANVIRIGDTQTAGSISLGAALTTGTINIGGTGAQIGAINLGVGTGAQTISLGTGAGAKTVVLGSTNTTSATTVQSGSGGVNINASNNQPTNINTGTSTGAVNIASGTGANAVAIGNSASTTTVLGVTNINTTGTAATSIGNSGAVTTLTGSSILLNSGTLQRTAAGTTAFDLVDGANTTLALQNSGAGVANLTVDGSVTAVGVNSGTGLLQGTGGLTLTGATLINTTGTANTSIGNATGTFELNSNTIDISTAGVLSGATGITSSGSITFSGLTPDRLVTTGSGGVLQNTISSANLALSISDETGTGLSVFATSPTLSTSLLTDSTSFDLLNTTATTVNAFGAATTVSLGASTGTTTVNNNLTVNGSALFQNDTNSSTALQVLNSDGDEAFTVNTTNASYASARLGGAGYSFADLSFYQGASQLWSIGTDDTITDGFYIYDEGSTNAPFTLAPGGSATFQNGSNSASAFQVKTLVGGTNRTLLNVDTTNELLTVTGTIFDSATVQAFTGSGNITQSNIDTRGTILISSNAAGYTATLLDPTITTAGRLVYVTNTGAFDMTLAANSGGSAQAVTLKPYTSATMIWNGSDWTAAGASSSTDLQAAYNNTATSAGGAELILNAPGGAADGLTIRNNPTTPITGGLLEVQTSIGSNLFTVNNNATEFATNGGAETAGATASTFPASTWDTTTGGTVDRFTTTGANVATGQASVRVQTTSTNHGARNRISTSLTSGLTYTVSFAVRGVANFSTLQVLYSPDGTTSGTTTCVTGDTVTSGQWTRVSCTFVASGTITSSNSILIRQTDATARTFYIDNLSVNINAAATYAADGSVDVALGTNWTAYGTGVSVARDTTVIYDTSGSASATTPATANRGIRNNLSVVPQTDTQYLVSFYARSTTTITNDLAVGFLPTGGTGVPSGTAACTDYNTQTLTANVWTKITCLFTTTSTTITDADVVIYQEDASARTIYVDALTITLNTNNSNNVQVGGGNRGGPVTLFTLDRSAGNPIADNNEAYLGSMYYDTITGRIQCYEADGWGACGAAPDNVVNLNPEYAGAVLNGSGVGTMTADFCSNDAQLSVNSTFCGTGEAKNFYNWTSPQATQQTYSIYVTYQLPETFNGFSSDDTVQLVARVDNTTNASVTYEMFRSTGSDVTQCGTGETNVITGGGGSADTWYSYGINGNESTGCSFNSAAAGDFVIFKINMKAQSNANAYVSTLSFVTTGR